MKKYVMCIIVMFMLFAYGVEPCLSQEPFGWSKDKIHQLLHNEVIQLSKNLGENKGECIDPRQWIIEVVKVGEPMRMTVPVRGVQVTVNAFMFIWKLTIDCSADPSRLKKSVLTEVVMYKDNYEWKMEIVRQKQVNE